MSCRTCNSSKVNLKDLYQESYNEDGIKVTLADKLEALTGFKINPIDSSSKQICFQCKLLLDISYEFQKSTRENEQKLFAPELEDEIDIGREDEHEQIYVSHPEMDQNVEVEDAEMFEEEEFLDDQQQITEAVPPSPPKKEVKSVSNVSFSCEECDKIFHTKSAMDLHRKLRHKRASESPLKRTPLKQVLSVKSERSDSNSISKSANKMFCSVCEKQFHTEKALMLHVKTKHK